MYNIHLLPAAYGDAILVEYGTSSPKYILIDGGPYYNFDELAEGIKRVAPKMKTLELLVITHIDIDHIDGIVTMLKRSKLPFKIKDIWFNGYEQIGGFSDTLGVLQGEYISEQIRAKKLPHNEEFKGKPVVVKDYKKLPVIKLAGGMNLTLLSPGKTALGKLHDEWKKEIKKYGKDPDFAQKLEEDKRYDSDDDILGEISIKKLQETKVTGDKAIANGSSISFLATHGGKTCLFAADTPSDYLLEAIDPMLAKSGKSRLKVDAWKLAHHGSKKSTLDKLMKKIDCKKLLVSSNGAKFKHPDQPTIAKLLLHNGPNLQFYFNYFSEYNDRWADEDLQSEHKFKASYPKNAEKPGITVKL
jgi:beta-lactamase superfamily II metal-dependent hydrolase